MILFPTFPLNRTPLPMTNVTVPMRTQPVIQHQIRISSNLHSIKRRHAVITSSSGAPTPHSRLHNRRPRPTSIRIINKLVGRRGIIVNTRGTHRPCPVALSRQRIYRGPNHIHLHIRHFRHSLRTPFNVPHVRHFNVFRHNHMLLLHPIHIIHRDRDNNIRYLRHNREFNSHLHSHLSGDSAIDNNRLLLNGASHTSTLSYSKIQNRSTDRRLRRHQFPPPILTRSHSAQ